MDYFIGIDNSKKEHHATVIDRKGGIVKQFSISNDLLGFKRFQSMVSEFKKPGIGLELGHGPIIDFLRLNGYSKLFAINPLKIRRYKDILKVTGNKTDSIDSFAIASYLQANIKRIQPMLFSSPILEELKVRCISHSRLVQQQTRMTNSLQHILGQYFPLYSDLFSSSAPLILLQMILQYPTWAHLRKTSDHDLTEFFIQHKYRNPIYIQRVIKKIRTYDQAILTSTESALAPEAQAIAELLIGLKRRILSIEKEMALVLKQVPLGPVFLSLPGAGTILAAKMLSAFGDEKSRFKVANNAACLFGTAPQNYQSGSYQSGSYQRVIIRRACNKNARAAFYFFAFASLRYSEWARAYYDQQRAKGKKNSVAIRALSNKWIKVIFQMWKNCEPYQSQRLKNSAAA